MIRIGVKTKLSPEEVIKRSAQFFGPDGGDGLEITEQDETHICLQGGGGGVDVTACAVDDGTTVDVASTEWDSRVKEFVAKLH